MLTELFALTVSVLTTLFVFWLFFSELGVFMSHEVDPQLFVDTERSDKIRINMDVYFPNMPCDFLTLDAMDSAGELQLDLAHNVFKKRLRDGKPIGVVRENVAQRGQESRPQSNGTGGEVSTCGSCYGAQTKEGQCCNSCEEVREAYRVRGWAFTNPEGIAQCVHEGFSDRLRSAQGEGCQVYGYLQVNKVEHGKGVVRMVL